LDFDYIFKYILIGDSSVGKSTILSMFINGSYLSDSNPTMGVEFATKKLAVGDKVIKIQIWDTVRIE
jgi:GTPase SAR1 family protein